MKAYVSVFKMRLLNGLQYRSAALAGIATQFFFGFVFIMVFQAFYAWTETEPPMTLPELVSYIWLQQAFLSFIVLWFRDNELFQLITSGNIAYELCRPSDLYGLWFAKLLAQRLSSAFLRMFPILIVAMLLPRPYRLEPPPDVQALLLFLPMLLLGLLILVSISMMIYISTFVTMSAAGSLLLFSIAGEFLSGVIVPVPMMPDWLQSIIRTLPFWLTADVPFRVYTGHIGADEALLLIPLQLLWLAVLLATGKLAMRRVLRRVVVQGG